MSFPSDEQLNSKITRSTNWLKWRDVPINKWYHIVKREPLDTKNGEALILTLEDKDQNRLICFTTSLIKKELEARPESNFIKSSGKICTKKYYGFELVYHN